MCKARLIWSLIVNLRSQRDECACITFPCCCLSSTINSVVNGGRRNWIQHYAKRMLLLTSWSLLCNSFACLTQGKTSDSSSFVQEKCTANYQMDYCACEYLS